MTEPTAVAAKLRDWLLLCACNMVWAGQFVLVKLVEGEVKPVFATAAPMLVATALLVPVVVVERRRRRARGETPRPLDRASLASFAIIGVLGQVVAQLFVTWGTQRSLAQNASVLAFALPVATAVMAYVLLGERMTGLRWVSFALAIAGGLVASAKDLAGMNLAGSGYLLGNGLIFLGVLGSAFYNVYSKKLLGRFTPLEVLLGSYVAVCVFLLPVAALVEPESFGRIGALSARTWVGLGLLAVLQYGVSMVIFLTVLTRLDATQAALSNYMIPVFGLVLSWLVLGERLGLLTMVGGALVLGSTLLVTAFEERLSARARARAESADLARHGIQGAP